MYATTLTGEAVANIWCKILLKNSTLRVRCTNVIDDRKIAMSVAESNAVTFG